MEGQLSKYPLAELIREIQAGGLSGVLRLSRERVKAAVYFEKGGLVFATSNLRAHRLREVLKRNGFSEAQLNICPSKASDDELADALMRSGQLMSDSLGSARANQVSDVLRRTLLWTEGSWDFDPRVRLTDVARVRIDANRLVLECARHLPASFVSGRLAGMNGSYFMAANNAVANNLF